MGRPKTAKYPKACGNIVGNHFSDYFSGRARLIALLQFSLAPSGISQEVPYEGSRRRNSVGPICRTDYCLWFLRAQYWIDHPDAAYGKEFSKQLNLNPADEAAFRSIVGDFNKRYEQLLAEHYRKIKNREWTPETETKLIGDLVAATNDTIALIKTNLSAAGAMKVDNLMLHGGQGSVFETS